MELIATTAGFIIMLPLLYLFMLAGASMLPEKRIKKTGPRMSFCIIIPAHNEEDAISGTISAARAVDYPLHLFDIFVIADNCSDRTAELARREGARVLERKVQGPPGKGFVLQWAFERLLEATSHDAFVVIDADTWMEKDFLSVMNDCLCSGEKAVQAYSQVRNPERSLFESLSFLGFALNRNLRYRGRSRLGWSANLMGTGMCFHRDIIERYGWNTETLVEDLEYTMFLRIYGIRVCFADRAGISVELHSSASGTEGQRLRWDLGKMEVRNRFLPLLLKCAVKKMDLACLDSALELILPPFPIFFLMVTGSSMIFIPLSCINGLHACTVWLMNASGIVIYTAAGIISARATPAVYKALLHAPFIIVWRAWIVLRESLKKEKRKKW